MSMQTDQIEADISRSRSRLNQTIEELGGKLSPGQMLDEVLGLAQGQAGAFTAKLGAQVRDNPLPTLLIVAGIGMLMMNKGADHAPMDGADHDDGRWRKLAEARRGVARIAGETEHAFKDRLHQAQAAALNLKQDAGEAVDAFKLRVAEAAHAVERAALTAKTKIKNTAAAAKHGAEHFYDANPLAAGAIAMGVGALLGSGVPLSSAERDALSDVADGAARLASQAASKGADLAEQGARKVEDRLDALH